MVLLFGSICFAGPLKILLLSGRNNHHWQRTTPALVHIYQSSGRFIVDVTERPDTLNADFLKNYNVIVSNWCAWPDVTGERWPAETENAILDFVKSGKGMVFIHAAAATHQDWPEFLRLAGATWKKGRTGHGKVHTFTVNIEDRHHPVTSGLTDFQIRDELWHNMELQDNISVLARAFSSREHGGSGRSEPVVLTTRLEKGRGFYAVLGHDVDSMSNPDWQRLLRRGTYWSATGRTGLPNLKNPEKPTPKGLKYNFKWSESDTNIALFNGNQLMWDFKYLPGGKPHFPVIHTARNISLVWDAPPDHPWHKGLWFSWKYINGLNYWESDRITGLSEGRTRLLDIKTDKNRDFSCRLSMTISYHPPNKAPLLEERRTIRISRPDSLGHYTIDWTGHFTALENVVLDRTPIPGEPDGKSWGGYAGLGCRLDARNGTTVTFSDSHGRHNTDIHSNQTIWLNANLDRAEQKAGMTILESPENPGYPQPGFIVHNHLDNYDLFFAYMNPGLLYNSAYRFEKQSTFTLKYIIHIHDGHLDPLELAKLHHDFF